MQAYRAQEFTGGDTSAADRALAVRFYTDDVEDPVESKKQNRPIFKTVECCEIRIPGNRDEITQGPIKYIKPDPRERFPQAYARFKAGARSQIVGTLLREWGMIPSTRAKEYEALGVHTVEQLAAIGDSQAQAREWFGSLEDRQKAKDFLASAAGLAPVSQLREENEDLRAKLAELSAKVEAMAQGAPAPKRRGRPPKVKPPDTEN